LTTLPESLVFGSAAATGAALIVSVILALLFQKLAKG